MVPATRSVTYRTNIEEAFPIASTVHLNAVLIDEKAHIQYIGTLVWSQKEVLPNAAEMAKLDQPPDSLMFQLYRNFLDQKPIAPSIKASSVYYEAKEGKVYKILNENFGILIVDMKLVLFDTCDFWLDPGTTADTVSKAPATWRRQIHWA